MINKALLILDAPTSDGAGTRNVGYKCSQKTKIPFVLLDAPAKSGTDSRSNIQLILFFNQVFRKWISVMRSLSIGHTISTHVAGGNKSIRQPT
jgi:hypothetical protein